jgi:hypothetical protein
MTTVNFTEKAIERVQVCMKLDFMIFGCFFLDQPKDRSHPNSYVFTQAAVNLDKEAQKMEDPNEQVVYCFPKTYRCVGAML